MSGQTKNIICLRNRVGYWLGMWGGSLGSKYYVFKLPHVTPL